MARALLDTDILSEVIKKKDARVVTRADEYLATEGRLTVSVLSVMEIVYGFHRVGREDRISQFRSLIADHEVRGLDTATAATAGRIYADLERRGTPVGLTDVMIAAVALQHDLPIVTGNVSHFEAIREAGRNVQTASMDVLLRMVRDLPGSIEYLRHTAA